MKKRTGSSFAARMTAIAIAAVVTVTGTPALVLADEDGAGDPNEKEVTIEVVREDEENAKKAISYENETTGETTGAAVSVNEVIAADVPAENRTIATVKEEVTQDDGSTKEENKDVTALDVKIAIENGQRDLDKTRINIENAETYMNELRSEDENGNPVGLLPAATTAVITADAAVTDVQTLLQPVTDENGAPVYVQMVNPDGTPMTDPVTGAPVYLSQVDENGLPVTDEDGNPVYVQQTKLIAMIPELDENGKVIMQAVLDSEGNPVFTGAGRLRSGCGL